MYVDRQTVVACSIGIGDVHVERVAGIGLSVRVVGFAPPRNAEAEYVVLVAAELYGLVRSPSRRDAYGKSPVPSAPLAEGGRVLEAPPGRVLDGAVGEEVVADGQRVFTDKGELEATFLGTPGHRSTVYGDAADAGVVLAGESESKAVLRDEWVKRAHCGRACQCK